MGNEGNEAEQDSVTKQKTAPRAAADAEAKKPFEEETETSKLTGVGAW